MPEADPSRQKSSCDAPVGNRTAAGLSPATKASLSPSGDGASPPRVEITICMGSSCFSRGNNRNIEAVQEFLKAHPLPSAVQLAGHLCQGHCQSGPNVTIGGKMYHAVDPVVITGLIRHFATGEK